MTGSELVPLNNKVQRKHYRQSIPEVHQASLDTRIRWLWNQRFGTIQTISLNSEDLQDQTACTLIIQAIMGKDLDSIALIFRRLEGGPEADDEVLERSTLRV